MKFKIILKNNTEHIINADDYNEAQKVARQRFNDYASIRVLLFQKERKSDILNRREWIKESNKKYDRTKEKREFKRKLNEGEY